MTTINEFFTVNKDTTDFNNSNIIKKGTAVKGAFSGIMPNGEIRITTDKGQIINRKDLDITSAYTGGIAPYFPKTLADEMGIDTRVKIDPRESGGFSEKAKEQALLKTQQDYIESQRNVNESFLEKHKNHLLIAVALVAGYFAYKKFKK